VPSRYCQGNGKNRICRCGKGKTSGGEESTSVLHVAMVSIVPLKQCGVSGRDDCASRLAVAAYATRKLALPTLRWNWILPGNALE
jgi:hypothetical protein